MSTVSDINRRMWLLLYARRSWWTGREIEIQLSLDQSSAYQRLLKMSKQGSVVRITSKASGVRFAVLPGCTIPQGITVGELEEAATEHGLKGAVTHEQAVPA